MSRMNEKTEAIKKARAAAKKKKANQAKAKKVARELRKINNPGPKATGKRGGRR